MNKIALLLTATVEVAVKGGNFSNDERMEMYTNTLRYYRDTFGKKYPIVVVENSNADLTPWREQFKDSLNLEIVQFRSDNQNEYQGFDPSKGKGFNEYLMIKKAIDGSSKTLSSGKISHFLKITGRYPMINIIQIIKETGHRLNKKNLLFIGDIKDTNIYKIFGKEPISAHWGDSRFFVADINFYKKYMIDCYKEMNDYTNDRWAEHYFLNFSRKHRNDNRFAFRFRTQVRFGGVSGASTDVSYNSFANRIKAFTRQLLRYLFPNIWF